MSYFLFSVCTESYQDSYELMIDSWVRTSASSILVYTDGCELRPRDKVQLIPILDKGLSWFDALGYKSAATSDVLNKGIGHAVFVDIDCYLVRDLGHVFDLDFDIAVTRLDRNVSSGVYFLRSGNGVAKFTERWTELQAEYKKAKAVSLTSHSILRMRQLGNKYHALYEQLAFGSLCKECQQSRELMVLGLDHMRYNRKINPARYAKNEFDMSSIDILHFYGNCYKIDGFVNKVVSKIPHFSG